MNWMPLCVVVAIYSETLKPNQEKLKKKTKTLLGKKKKAEGEPQKRDPSLGEKQTCNAWKTINHLSDISNYQKVTNIATRDLGPIHADHKPIYGDRWSRIRSGYASDKVSLWFLLPHF